MDSSCCVPASDWWWCCNDVDVYLANFGPLIIPTKHCLNATVDHIHPYMTRVPIFRWPWGTVSCHKAQIFSNWFFEHDNEFAVLTWPTQPPDLSPTEHLWRCNGRFTVKSAETAGWYPVNSTEAALKLNEGCAVLPWFTY